MWMYSEPCISTQHIDTIERKRFSLLIGTNMVLTMRMESTHNFMSLIFSTFDICAVPHIFSSFSSSDAAYLHHWLSVTIHFNRYNHSFDKCTECRDKCKPLYFIALHIRVVPPLFSLFVECPLSDTRCWVIGHFRRCVTERLLNTKVVVFLGFLWFAWTFSSKEVDLQ